MDIEHSIPKKGESDEPHSFLGLRKEGIRLIQSMSGDVWTDYNLHDPGVTILEQVCYALTDLVYRSDFAVEDLLTGDDGNIAFGDQALHRPEDILPCRPWTVSDHEQVILDSCPVVDNAWVTASSDAGAPSACPGIYSAAVRLNSKSAAGSIQADIKKSLGCARNLCEDIHDSVVVLGDLDCYLLGAIEIDGSHEPSDVLATIYHCTVKYLAADVPDGQPQENTDSGTNLIEFFTGPHSVHGRTLPGKPGTRNDKVILADLVRMLQRVKGVVRVRDLALKVMYPDRPNTHHGSVARRHGNRSLWLRIASPGEAAPAQGDALRLLKHGRLVTAPVAATWNKYNQLVASARSARIKEVDPAALYKAPRGTKRSFGDYFSIQNHFPDIYGINAHGVPASAAPEARASARQLKGYLMLFEQIMANHLANVDGIRELFSNAGDSAHTYRFQVLDDKTIANAGQLYREEPGEFLREVITQFDDAAERKSRQLDYMLAVFGETFLQKSLRHFNYDSLWQDQHEEIARNKAAFLENIVELTRDRVGGRDYLAGESVGGFARRVGLLLGFHRHGASLTSTLRNAHLDPGGAETEKGRADGRAVSGNVPLVRLTSDSGEQALSDARDILRTRTHTQRLFAAGTDLQNYRIARHAHSDELTLQIGDPGGGGWQSLATYPDESRAALAANALRKYLVALCQSSEGLHVVEHVLLRPAGAAEWHAGREPRANNAWLWREFYPLRFSVVFPGWTKRCRDQDFRLLAEETVRVNSPAHVFGRCFWLGFRQMSEFEELYDRWASSRQQLDADPVQVDDRAVDLLDFLTSVHEGRR